MTASAWHCRMILSPSRPEHDQAQARSSRSGSGGQRASRLGVRVRTIAISAHMKGGTVVQNPWALLSQLTERNMEVWKGLQQGIKTGLSSAAEKPDEPTKTEPRLRKRAARQ